MTQVTYVASTFIEIKLGDNDKLATLLEAILRVFSSLSLISANIVCPILSLVVNIGDVLFLNAMNAANSLTFLVASNPQKAV